MQKFQYIVYDRIIDNNELIILIFQLSEICKNFQIIN